MTALVREFLDYFELEYTRSVFDPETNAVSFMLCVFHLITFYYTYIIQLETYPGRERLAKDLNLDLQASSSGPLLAYIVRQASQTPSPSSTSRQLKFPDTLSSSLPVSSGPSQLPTTAGSDVSRATVASSSTGASPLLYAQATPTLDSAQLSTSTGLGTQSGNDSEQLSHKFAQSQINDKHFKQPTVDLNTNGNSNTEGDLESRLASQLRSGPSATSGLPGIEGLGLGLGSLQSHGPFAELGETLVNSADSSLDVEKLINASTESERLHRLLKPSSGVDSELSRDELDDFFDSSLPSALQDSKEEDQLRSRSV